MAKPPKPPKTVRGDEPAYPAGGNQDGLTVRERMVLDLLAGLLAGSGAWSRAGEDVPVSEHVIDEAIELTDRLLAKLD